MSTIPSLTILSEEQKFNGENLLQWKTNIIQLLGLKGLLGYIDGKIEKPTQTEPPKVTTNETTATTAPAIIATPIIHPTLLSMSGSSGTNWLGDILLFQVN